MNQELKSDKHCFPCFQAKETAAYSLRCICAARNSSYLQNTYTVNVWLTSDTSPKDCLTVNAHISKSTARSIMAVWHQKMFLSKQAHPTCNCHEVVEGSVSRITHSPFMWLFQGNFYQVSTRKKVCLFFARFFFFFGNKF